MTDQPSPARADPGRQKRLRAVAAIGFVGLLGCTAVLYGMGGLGKKAPAVCQEAAGAMARLHPLIHGEVAALTVSRPNHLAPELSFSGPDGQPTSLTAFRGRTVLLNLWATWCVPCRKEMPSLDRLQAKLGGPDFQVVALNTDTARLDRPKAFLKDTGISSLSLYTDSTGTAFQVLRQDGQVLGLPTTLLVDPNGCELGVMMGPAAWDSPDAEKLIDAAKAAQSS